MPINSNTPEIFRNIDGEGSVKLKTAITAGITVGGIAAGSILSENMTFTQFVQAIVSDDTDMSFSVIGWDKEAGEADPEAFSHIELDDDGNPTRPVTVKITVVPGRDDIELLEIQKIITTTDPITGDTVTKKVAAGKVPAKKASDRSGSSNEFIMDIAFTAEEAAADSVDIRVSAYEYVVSPDHPAKPTVEPDTKPSNGNPSKLFTASVSFGEGTATKATITAGSTQTVGDGVSATFPIVGSVAIGDDGLTREGLTALKICEGTTVLAESSDPTTVNAIYDLVIVADYSVADHTVSKTLTTIATFGTGDTAVTKEASATYKVVATEVTATTVGVTTSATNPATDIENGTEVTFPLVGTVTIGDDGLTRAGMTALKLVEGTTVLASAADPTTDNVTFDAKITADYSSTSHAVTRTIKVVGEWGATVTKEGTIELKVVAKEPTGTTVKITSVPASPATDVESGTVKTFALTGTVNIGTDGLTRADMTNLKIMEGTTELAAAADPTTDDVTFNLNVTADYAAAEHKTSRTVKIIGTWADATTKEAEYTFEVVAKEPELKVYFGTLCYPPEVCRSYTIGGDLISNADYAAWPTTQAIAVSRAQSEEAGATGNIYNMYYGLGSDDIYDQQTTCRKLDTHHWDAATETIVEGSVFQAFPEMFSDAINKTVTADQKAEIRAKRRPFICGLYTLGSDSAELAQMTSASGWTWDEPWPLSESPCGPLLVEMSDCDDPSDPSCPGNHPSTWNMSDGWTGVWAFPKAKYQWIKANNGTVDIDTYTGEFTLNGAEYVWVREDVVTSGKAAAQKYITYLRAL